MKINFMSEQVPDVTTLLKFRHMIEENHLGEEFFKAINRVMEATGHIMHGGTIVDAKSAVRCKVEHAFKIIKDTFGFRKVRYKGIAKNLNKLNVLFACANMLMVKRVQTDFRPAKG